MHQRQILTCGGQRRSVQSQVVQGVGESGSRMERGWGRGMFEWGSVEKEVDQAQEQGQAGSAG